MTLEYIWNRILTELEDRKNMPQIDHTDMPTAFKILTDAGIGISMKSVLPSQLKHSQSKVNNKKVQSIVKDFKSGKKLPPIVIANDYLIVDGHHRQVAYDNLNPSEEIWVVMIDLSWDKAIMVYKKVEDIL